MLSGKGIIYNRCPSQIHKPCTEYFKQTTHVKVIILKYENAYSSITRVKVFFFLSRHMYLLNDESVLYFC